MRERERESKKRETEREREGGENKVNSCRSDDSKSIQYNNI